MKTITSKNVKDYINAAPLSILYDLQDCLNKKIERSEGSDTDRGVLRALAYNDSLKEAPLPNNSTDNDNNSSNGKNARSQLSEMFNSKISSNSNTVDTTILKQQLDKIQSGKDEQCLDLQIMFIYTDKYDDGMVRIKSKKGLETIERLHQECKDKGWYFPYGFGKSKDLLKIKNFSRPQKGEICRIVVRFRSWSNQSRSGYSCYICD